MCAADVGWDARAARGAGASLAAQPLGRLRRTAPPPASPRRTAPTDRRGRRRARPRAAPTVLADSSAEWLPGWPSVGKSPRLDRVGEDHRPGGRRLRPPARKASSRSARSWPPRSRIARASSASSSSPTSRSSSRRAATAAGQALAQLAGGAAQQPLVLLVGHRVDPARAAPRRRGASNSSRSRRPYLTVIACQPAASNIAARAGRPRCPARRGRATGG